MMAMASSTAVATKGRATRPAVMPTLLTDIQAAQRRDHSAGQGGRLVPIATSATTVTARPPSALIASVVASGRRRRCR